MSEAEHRRDDATDSRAGLAHRPGSAPAPIAPHHDDVALLADLFAPGLGPSRARAAAVAGLEHAGGLRALATRSERELAALPDWGPARARAFLAARGLVRRQLEEGLRRGRALTSPADTLAYLRTALGDRRREVFTGLFLDTRHRVLACEELFKGSIDGACVYPRIVAEKALRFGAAAVIVAHNHPSGVSEPSLADQAITHRLRDALALLEIRLLDHFVIGDGEPVSLASRGML